jgi:hypothetical protein
MCFLRPSLLAMVGEFNARVKGREKFWNRPERAEAILQVRAALLSEDDRLVRHFAQRQGCPPPPAAKPAEKSQTCSWPPQ